MTIGATNASYIVQMVTILDQTWINQFQVKLLFGDQKMINNEKQDRTVILISVAFSILNYVVYIPELVMVGDIFMSCDKRNHS